MCRYPPQNPHKMCRYSKKTLIKRDGAFFLRYNTDNKGRNEMLISEGSYVFETKSRCIFKKLETGYP